MVSPCFKKQGAWLATWSSDTCFLLAPGSLRSTNCIPLRNSLKLQHMGKDKTKIQRGNSRNWKGVIWRTILSIFEPPHSVSWNPGCQRRHPRPALNLPCTHRWVFLAISPSLRTLISPLDSPEAALMLGLRWGLGHGDADEVPAQLHQISAH